MTFKNEAQLKKFLMDKCTNAVANAERKVHEEFAGNLNQFYTEFRPEEYVRTGALFNALEVTGVKRAGNCVTTEIYFNNPSYEHGWVPLQSGGYGYSYWTDDYILDVAMTGKLPHGGYEDGTAIWTDSMAKLGGRQGIKILLIQELKKQGL
jgi:hypothetical protein